MRVSFYTLGCKVNQAEAGSLQRLFLQQGHSVVSFEPGADLYVVTTCTVTALSDKKCRQVIRRVRRENPNAIIAVCGCYSQTKPDEVASLGADIVCGVTDRKNIVSLAEEFYIKHEPKKLVSDVSHYRVFEPLSADSNQGRTRALLKIQDGCDNFCTYCIIPYVRGRSRSLSPDDVLLEAKRLREEGFQEIVITGIEISSYGKDLHEKPALYDLIQRILAELPDVRIRLGSLEPRTIDDQFCNALSGYKNFCPHFHLSLQSGSDTVLKQMGRKYRSKDYLEAVNRLYSAFPGCAVTTDLIVGFPFETQEDFQNSLSLIKDCSLFMVHVFPYSKRLGTKAAELENQISKIVKEQRAREAGAVAKELKNTFLKAQVGKVDEILFESEDYPFSIGHTKNYCPVRVKSSENLRNTLKTVRITGSDEDYLYCEFE
ncbi:MAG: tRNA (N(6)-L-threonylcarbamoyladenosine(37)-C(2))-methylthiotransferase MtaB [Clostridiales bacterium]|nr:tRNA (N(6)-L-threonylcarbamoyladenosine(37)-C(2))-methylthiotransferase MtaB [Clostridiales bacterium]